MKSTIFKFIAILGTAAFLATGCIKETFPEGSTVTASQVASSPSALTAMLNSIPAAMVTTGTAGYLSSYSHHGDFGIGEIHMITENMLEDFVTLGDNPYYNRNYSWGMNENMGEDYWPCAYFWDCYYPWIKICNDIISSILAAGEDVSKTNAPIIGRAYAYRAYFYLDLARLYEYKKNKYFDNPELEGLTVPIINEKTDETSAANNPRAKRDSVYTFILDDLKKAENFLTGTENSVYEPGIDLINGLYARTYLEIASGAADGKDAYGKAIEYANKVINAGYSVLTQSQWEDPVNGFNNATSNKSWIWGLGITAENFNNICTYAAFICAEGQWGYAPLVQLGASKKFYDAIPDSDFRKHSWLDPGRMNYYKYQLSGTPQNGTEFLEGNSNVPAAKDYEAIKFRPAGGNCIDNVVGNAVDQCMMRVEEMYFIKMEALANTNLGEAKECLTSFMRNRLIIGEYECKAASKEEFLEEMLFQKRVEFWGEGILMFDYKRLDHGITRGYEGTNWPVDWCFNCEGRSPQWNIVITRAETQANKGIPKEMNNPDPSSFVPNWVK